MVGGDARNATRASRHRPTGDPQVDGRSAPRARSPNSRCHHRSSQRRRGFRYVHRRAVRKMLVKFSRVITGRSLRDMDFVAAACTVTVPPIGATHAGDYVNTCRCADEVVHVRDDVSVGQCEALRLPGSYRQRDVDARSSPATCRSLVTRSDGSRMVSGRSAWWAAFRSLMSAPTPAQSMNDTSS